jgi:hypothetical protein
VGNNKLTKFTTKNGGLFQVSINSLTPEDGGGKRYLINYKDGNSDGYVDTKSMEGFLQQNYYPNFFPKS